jgi:hypothetical protein
MRPTLLRRIAAVLAAFALIVTMGLQGMQAAAMVAMKSDMSMSTAAPSDSAAVKCANCDNAEKGTVAQCQTASICAPSIAVLPIGASISIASEPAGFEAEDVSFDGRTGMPELHPPKTAAPC